jgi:hypothetical protein
MPAFLDVLKKFRFGCVTTEVQWSELQRDPKGVAALADQGDVRVRRRDGVPLLLVREDSAGAAAEGALTAARALRSALAHLDASDALTEEFPWADLVPEPGRRRFAADFVRAVQALGGVGQVVGTGAGDRRVEGSSATRPEPGAAAPAARSVG